jgi:hypothetical protein
MQQRFFFIAVVTLLALSGNVLFAQTPDSRIWPLNTKQVQMLNGTVWMEVPRAAQQSGNIVRLAAVNGFRPNINALFEFGSGSIRSYRLAALPNYTNFGFRILRERVVYNRIWEIESVTPSNGLRYYQRVFQVNGGFVVVTATARNRNWQHSSVRQLIDSMRSLNVR